MTAANRDVQPLGLVLMMCYPLVRKLFILKFPEFLCSERWVLHSTAKYAQRIISEMGLEKPSNAALAKVADELFQEFERTGLNISEPFFKKAHRWLVSSLVERNNIRT